MLQSLCKHGEKKIICMGDSPLARSFLQTLCTTYGWILYLRKKIGHFEAKRSFLVHKECSDEEKVCPNDLRCNKINKNTFLFLMGWVSINSKVDP